MIPTRVYHYRDPAAVILGLKELRKKGLTPRGILFVALDPRGETYIAVPEDLDAVANVRVGDKLSLECPWQGRYFHLDAVHRLPGDTVLWNGDRRLGDTGSAPEVACAISEPRTVVLFGVRTSTPRFDVEFRDSRHEVLTGSTWPGSCSWLP